jgi:hypothetical protein
LLKKWNSLLFVSLSLLLLLGCSRLGVEENGPEVEQENTAQSKEEDSTYMEKTFLVITFEDEQLKATIEDNATTRDFIQQLPMTVTMKDLYNQEKYVEIRGLTVKGSNISHYSKGDISYWTPGEAFVIYYKGNEEPLNGLVKIGEILGGVEKLENYPGDIEVTIDSSYRP